MCLIKVICHLKNTKRHSIPTINKFYPFSICVIQVTLRYFTGSFAADVATLTLHQTAISTVVKTVFL